nr:hypothetical protein [Tanacetum cinerariifolium]
MQTQTSNALHNAIMEACGKDRPPMLASVTQGSSETTTEGCMENYNNVSQDIRDQLNVEAEAKSIKRLKQGESINVQDLETNLYWEFRKFTSRDVESLESYYSRFYKMMNELVRNQCDVTNHQVNAHFLLQLQPEWQRSQQTTRNRGKAIVNSSAPIYDQEPAMVIEDDGIANQDNSLRINKGTGYENQRVVNVARARETVEVTPDSANNYGPIFDVEPLQKVQNNDDNYNVFGEDQEYPKKPDSVNEPYPDMCYDREQDDQDDTDELAQERDLLASLIEKLKCEIDDIKNRNKSLETSNKDLVDKLKESSNNYFKEANNELSKTNQLMFKDLKKF